VVLKLVVVAVEDVLVMFPVEFAEGAHESVVKMLVVSKANVVLLLSLFVTFQGKAVVLKLVVVPVEDVFVPLAEEFAREE
jgi:hypothetical protein